MSAAADVTRVHVLGAGRMGQGIALVFAFAGIDVTLIDFKRRDAAGQRAFDDRTRDEIASRCMRRLRSDASMPRRAMRSSRASRSFSEWRGRSRA